ncbi:sugar phosphate isomerase/epimerase [Kitasatospora sp. SolWspMP-SS2h]|uniref:sugar phosphate isomerase/epimerase family protein n=1 Tax=Kitasatospora sp. SolWspMP-SS2h TaxID=1305729 RepID=UPI000DBF9EFB|nr:sugar phosphate isomerase/epimerase [Kitasatospora sp. SolWspMP-SS2h]RAJ31967.1 sugar phosphate isomerase/epimerase [Kitasatospora sp. SolWspMP-SS2h]
MDRRPTVRFGGIGDEAAPDLAGQLDALEQLGWSELELRTVDGIWIADLPLGRVTALARTLRRRGVRVCGLASRIGNWASDVTDGHGPEERELAALAERAALLGTDRVRVMSYPNGTGLPAAEWRRRVLERMRRVAAGAGRGGLVALHENCAGWGGASAENALDLLASVDSPGLRLLHDTGNGAAYGYDGFELLRRTVGHVDHVHLKDAVGHGADTRYVLPGAGDARLAESLRLLTARGWRGVWSLEPHLATRPHQGLAADGGTDSGFVAAGRALTDLIEREVLPHSPGWRLVPGGLVRDASVPRATDGRSTDEQVTDEWVAGGPVAGASVAGGPVAGGPVAGASAAREGAVSDAH